MEHTLAIDIGGTKLALGIFRQHESQLELVERAEMKTDRRGGPAWMLDAIEEQASRWLTKIPVRHCGVGFGGPVDFTTQRVICSTHVEGWDNYDLVGELKRRLNVAAIIDRDTMVGALGEGYYGAAAGVRPIFYITISTGIGGGLLTDFGLYHGADSFSCEIGHITVEPDGPLCLCGARGCLERLCSGLWLERDHGRAASELFKDETFIQGYVKPLAKGLKTCIMLLNPACIVIGGGISKAGDALFVPLRAELRRQLPAWSKARMDVVPAQLGDDSILYGAFALANVVNQS